MLFLLSPAKSLDYESPLNGQPHSSPLFVKQSKGLIDVLRTYSPQQISGLMDLSDNLATLNVARYAAWSTRATAKNARQAVLAFDGDVYGGLEAKTLDSEALNWAQDHVCILSGLYGVLRPLDLMQAYRLEMGTALQTPHGNTLYDYWGTQIADYLNKRLKADVRGQKNGETEGAPPLEKQAAKGVDPKDRHGVVVNLASQEYFKAVDTRALKGRVVECVFQEYKDGQYKIISFFAKRARGLMARYAIDHRLTRPDELRAFDTEGYAWDAKSSSDQKLVFRRKP